MISAHDESLLHQVALPFGEVGTSDHRFYDRCWVAAYDPTGGMALNLGMGVYPNMNVTDGFVCVVRDRTQHNVRVSRDLARDVDSRIVGPLEYEVVEPLRQVRLRLADNPAGVACDLHWVGAHTPFHEASTTTRLNGRLATDVQRYDQTGTVNGWIEVGGVRHQVEQWFGARDHSWGVRSGVGGFEPQTGASAFAGGFLVTWLLFATDDLAGYVQVNRDASGHETFIDGRLRPRGGDAERRVRSVSQDIRFPTGSRLYETATIALSDDSGEEHVVECRRLCDPIVMRGAGYDQGWNDGGGLGVYRGDLLVETDRYDITTAETPLLDGTTVYGMQREQPVHVTVDGKRGTGDFTVLAFGDLSFVGVAADAAPLTRAPSRD